MEKKLFNAIANGNAIVAKKELIKAANKVELLDEIKTLSDVLFDLNQLEACGLAMELKRILRNPTRLHELEIETLYPCHWIGDAEYRQKVLVFKKSTPEEVIREVVNYYGMDSGYYSGAGYSYARNPERIEKGSRILIIQECGMDI